MSIVKDAFESSGPRKPVTEAVAQVLPEIAEALYLGATQGGIYRALKKRGLEVGAGISSFNDALRRLRPQLDALLEQLGSSGVVGDDAEPEDDDDGDVGFEWRGE